MRVVLDLVGDERATIRLLKALLKLLGRVHGVRCSRIEEVRSDGDPKEA